MFLLVHNENNFTGLIINGNEHKIVQIADNTTFILNGTEKSLNAALNVLEIFGSMSGLKTNSEKTKLVWIGKKRYSKDKYKIKTNVEWGATHFYLLGINFSVDLNEMSQLNYPKVIQSIERLLTKWNQRYLTPLGKITVIKTLALSKLNYLFMALPSPSNKTIKALVATFFKFVWNGKPDKVKRNNMVKCYTSGGLNMIDLENFLYASKLTWIRRLHNSRNSPWAQIYKWQINDIERIITLGSKHSELIAKKIQNKFWLEILQYWSLLISKMPVNTPDDALTIPLWSNGKISKSDLSLPHWYKRGIITPADLIDSQGNFISQATLKSAFGINTNFLEYHRVTTCVKSFYKKLTNTALIHKKPIYPTQIKILQSSHKGTRVFYNILNTNKHKIETPLVYSFWEQALEIRIPESMWKQIYRICFRSIKDNSIIWLQYRILHRILGTNEYMFRIKKRVSSQCNICNDFPETILHLFTECRLIKQF